MNSPGTLILPPDKFRFVVPGVRTFAEDDHAFVVSFDTSGIVRLERELPGDREALVAGLKTLGFVRVTGLNVTESIAIVGDHRARRMTLIEALTGEFKPLQPPNELLADIARSYHARRGSVTLGDDACWIAIKDHTAISDDMAAESAKWHGAREDWFRGMHRELREAYAPIFKKYKQERPRSASFMIRYFIERAPQYWDMLLIPIYARQTGYRPSHDEFERFLKRVPAWKMFWLARIYAQYRRAIRLTGYGSKNAGINDLDTAIYLPFCDWFVTNDARQRRALRVVNAVNPRNTQIMSYDTMRARLFGF